MFETGHAEAIKETQWRNILDSLQQMELQLLRQQLDVQGMDDILAHGCVGVDVFKI